MAMAKLSILRTIWTDWPAFAAAVCLPIFSAIFLGLPYLKQGQVPRVSTLAILSVPLLAFVAWRVLRVARLFFCGTNAVGNIRGLSGAKDRGRLDFVYTIGSEPVSAWTPVHLTKEILALVPGQPVEVLYDPNRPKRAIVKHLYEAREGAKR